MEEAGLQLPDFEESDFYVEQEQVNCTCVPAHLSSPTGGIFELSSAAVKVVVVVDDKGRPQYAMCAMAYNSFSWKSAECLYSIDQCKNNYGVNRWLGGSAAGIDVTFVLMIPSVSLFPPFLVAFCLAQGCYRSCCWRGCVLDGVHWKVLRRCGGGQEANTTGARLGKIFAAGVVGPQVHSAPEHARVHRVREGGGFDVHVHTCVCLVCSPRFS